MPQNRAIIHSHPLQNPEKFDQSRHF